MKKLGSMMRAGVSLMTACGVEVCRRIQCERACAQTSARRESWPWIVAETLNSII